METEEAFRRFGTNDTHERGYRPLKRLSKWRSAGSVDTPPSGKGARPFNSSTERLCKWMSVPAVGAINALGEGYRLFAVKQLHAMKLKKHLPESVPTTLPESGTPPTHFSEIFFVQRPRSAP